MPASGRPARRPAARSTTTCGRRARGWALNLAIKFLSHSEDNPVLLEVGRRALRTVLEEQFTEEC
jgi:hypothetical protein